MMKFDKSQELSEEDYATAAKIYVETLTKEAASSETARREYGRWMITTLVITHSAAIAGLAKYGQDSSKLLTSAGWYFVAGIILGFLSGLCASTYFALNTRRLYFLSDPSQIFLRSYHPVVPKRLRVAILTVYILSIGSGAASVAMLFVGANAASRILLSG